ncbi:carbohydrate binding domain-containing protein [Aquibacillus kalidii]|uniref:carbohydrate binding domain-containing protein n=1 Tax=Aquibacillus kalidii TaxID=2762597 RepID=UPI0016457CDA|nr:carbohydrate binding domain-containing protein [Aquibacillus kalidii]
MFKKSVYLLLIALLVFSNFNIAVFAATDTGDGTTLYLLNDGNARILSDTAGSAVEADIIPKSGDSIAYVVENVSGSYNGGGNAVINYYLNGLAGGSATHARVSYDFDGDGNWDRVERTDIPEQMNTNADVALGTYEYFNRNLVSESGEHGTFVNGKIKVEAWLFLKPGDVELKVNAPSEASTVVLPYDLTIGGSGSDEPTTGEGGSGDGTGDSEGGSDDTVDIPESHYTDWEMVWNDEFDGTEVDTSKWGYQNGTGAQYGLDGWGNQEEQYYQPENATVEDGKLVVTAKKESKDGKAYTSARLFTEPTYAKKYGKFEAKMKLPEGDGLWPAFWMMPKDSVYGNWASSGEIDIMEARGRLPQSIGGTIHYGGSAPANKFSGGEYEFEEGDDITNFHVYSVEWEPGEIRWYVDGKLYHTENNWNSIGADQPTKYAYPAPFDQEFYIILNLAVGGTFDGGRTPADSDMPAEMEVDYVRVYELEGRDYKEPVEPVIEVEPLPDDAKEPTADGNLIHDANFEHVTEITASDTPLDKEYWNFAKIDTFGGAGELTTEAIGGDTFAKVDITHAGTQAYSLQLIQYLTLGKGRHYKVSFDAKSNTNRDINVKLGADDSAGWAVYSDSETFNLTDEVQSYDFTFQMKNDTNPLARIELNLGLNTNPVWLGNIRVEEVEAEADPYQEDAAKEPLGNGNHVYNGTFDLGEMDRMTYWHFDASTADASASVDSDTRELSVAITDGGSSAEDITLTQKGMNLLKNNNYQFTFDAKAEEERDVTVKLVSEDGSTVYGEDTISLTTNTVEHTASFAMSEENDVNGQLVILLGGSNADVTMDNVKLVRTTNNIDYSGIDIFPLDNGDFSSGMTGWETYFHNDGAAGNSTNVNGESVTSISSVGGQPWGIQLFQSGMSFTKGMDYVLSFDAKSSKNRTIGAILENSSYTRYVDETVQLTDTMQNYEFEFKMSANDTADLKFLLGMMDGSESLGAHDVTIDNVVLEVKDAPYDRAPSLTAEQTDITVGSDVELLFNDDQTWRENITAVKVDGQALAESDYTIEAGKITLPASLFPEAAVYKIVIESDGYAPTSVEQTIKADDGNLILNGDFTNGTQSWATWSGEGGAATFEVTNGVANLDVTALGAYDYANQFFQDGIDLEVGKTYELSFKASSTINRPISVEIFGSGSTKIPFQLTADMQTFTRDFTATAANDTLKLNFMLGGVTVDDATTPSEAHTISFDDFVLKEKGVDPDLDKDWVEVGDNLVIDGTFDTTTEFGIAPDNLVEGWNIFNQATYEEWAGLADFSVVDGQLNAQVKQVGWQWYHIQLLQVLDVPAGTYKLSFDAKSDHTRPVSVELKGSEVEAFTVSNTMKTYEAIIEVAENGNKQLLFGLGRGATDPELAVPYNIVMDNVRLVKVEEDSGTEDPETENPGTEGRGTEGPTQDDNQTGEGDQSSEEGQSDDNQQSEDLPNTATSVFNYMLAGMIILLFGGFLYIRNRRTQ